MKIATARKKIIFLILIFVIGIFFGRHWFKKNQNDSFLSSCQESRNKEVIVNGQTFSVELAVSEQEKRKGLGGRDNLCESCGMLFIFSALGKHPFWMKGVRFPLDIIWIRGNVVVYVKENLEPHSTTIVQPDHEADKVLEINGGLSKRYNIKPGVIIDIKPVCP